MLQQGRRIRKEEEEDDDDDDDDVFLCGVGGTNFITVMDH